MKPQLIQIALENCSPTEFELYSQTVLGAILGPKFKPLGRNKDGGADGFIDTEISEEVDRPTRFFQASKQLTVEVKIRDTVSRLRQVGRDVQILYYASSQLVPYIDKLQYDLGNELNVAIHIYDRAFFIQRANVNHDVEAAYQQYLAPATAFLDDLKNPSFPVRSPFKTHKPYARFWRRNSNEGLARKERWRQSVTR